MTIAVSLYILIHYRPQRSCGKVMFSQASVIKFTGFVVWQTPPLQTHTHTHTPWSDTPQADTLQADTPFPGQTPPGQAPPRETPPLPSACWDTHTPHPVHAGIHTLPLPSARWPLQLIVRILLECILVI